jgi:hypothetical protein
MSLKKVETDTSTAFFLEKAQDDDYTHNICYHRPAMLFLNTLSSKTKTGIFHRLIWKPIDDVSPVVRQASSRSVTDCNQPKKLKRAEHLLSNNYLHITIEYCRIQHTSPAVVNAV